MKKITAAVLCLVTLLVCMAITFNSCAQTNYTGQSYRFATPAGGLGDKQDTTVFVPKPPGTIVWGNSYKHYYVGLDGFFHILGGASTGLISGLTAPRIPFASSPTTITDAANFTYNTSFVTVPALNATSLTNHRVTTAGASGRLTDFAEMTYSSGTNVGILTIGNNAASGGSTASGISINSAPQSITATDGTLSFSIAQQAQNGAGNFNITGGDAVSGSGSGGQIIMRSGNGVTTGAGGPMTIQAGNTITGTAGFLELDAGSASSANGNGGSAFLRAGNSAGTGVPGSVTISGGGGGSGTGSNAGDILLNAGGNAGDIVMTASGNGNITATTAGTGIFSAGISTAPVTLTTTTTNATLATLNGTGSGNGVNLNLTAGTAPGAGTGGNVIITSGTTSGGTLGKIGLRPGGDGGNVEIQSNAFSLGTTAIPANRTIFTRSSTANSDMILQPQNNSGSANGTSGSGSVLANAIGVGVGQPFRVDGSGNIFQNAANTIQQQTWATNTAAGSTLTISTNDLGTGLFLQQGVDGTNNAQVGFAESINGASIILDGTGLITITSPSKINYSLSATIYTVPLMLSNSATLNFPSTTAGTASDLTVTLTGAVDGDLVTLGVPNVSTLADGVFTCWVSAANTVKVRFANNSLTLALDPASGTFKVGILR